MLQRVSNHLSLGWLALSAFGLGGCGGDVGIVVTVENWPAAAPYLLIDTQVNSAPGQRLRIPAGQQRFVVRLPNGETGDLTLRASALDDTGCKLARGELTTSLTGGLRRTKEGTLSLATLNPALCPISIAIKSGSGTVISTPAGLSCTDSRCDGEFPLGSKVLLEPRPGDYKQFSAWATGCSGYEACQVTVDRGTEESINFKLREFLPGSEWYYQHPKDANDKILYYPGIAALNTVQIDENGVAWAFGDSGSILRCDKAICKPISVGKPVNYKFSTYADKSVWASGYDGTASLVVRCQSNSCEIAYNLPDIASCSDIKLDGKIVGNQRALYGLTSTTPSNVLVRLATDRTSPKCEKVLTGSSIQDLFGSENNVWFGVTGGMLSSGAYRMDCSGLTACGQPALLKNQSTTITMYGVRGIAGNSSDIFIWNNQSISGSPFMRCSRNSNSCSSISIPPMDSSYIYDSNSVYATEKSAWTAVYGNGGYKIAHYDTASLGSSATRIQSEYMNILYGIWANDKQSWFAGYKQIAECAENSCRTFYPVSYVYAINGKGNDVWAVGEDSGKGVVLLRSTP